MLHLIECCLYAASTVVSGCASLSIDCRHFCVCTGYTSHTLHHRVRLDGGVRTACGTAVWCLLRGFCVALVAWHLSWAPPLLWLPTHQSARVGNPVSARERGHSYGGEQRVWCGAHFVLRCSTKQSRYRLSTAGLATPAARSKEKSAVMPKRCV